MKRRILSAFLVLMMVFSVLPISVAAYINPGRPYTVEVRYYINDGDIVSYAKENVTASLKGREYKFELADPAELKITNPKYSWRIGDEFTRKGYHFAGWMRFGNDTVYNPGELVAVDYYNSFMAKWKLNTYTVEFDANGGNGTMNSQPFTYGEKKALTGNEFSKVGYTFTGWNTQADGKGDAYADKGDVSNLTDENNGTVKLYAQWTPNTYKITLDLNGGEYEGDTEWNVVYDSTYSIPNGEVVTKTGYTLLGWNLSFNNIDYLYAKGATLEGLPYGVAGDVTFTALWKANVYDDGIILDGMGGKIKVEGKEYEKFYKDMTYDTTFTLPVAERVGYTFKGWKLVTDSREVSTFALRPEVDEIYDAGTEIYFDITTGMTFEAQWQANKYTVTFDADGGSYTGAKKMVVVFDQPYGKLPKPTKAGCSFQYWADENGRQIDENCRVKLAKDHTLTAVYHVNELRNTEQLPSLLGLNLSWNKEGGSVKGVHYSNRDLLIARYASRTLTFEPAEGYEVSEVFVNGKSVGDPESLTIGVAVMDYNVKVVFAPLPVYTPVYAEDFTGETSNWQVGGQLENFAIADGTLKMTSTGGDPIIMPVENFNLKADDIDVIRIRYKNATGNANVQVFFTSDANTGLSEAGSFKATAANVDGTEWNEIVIDTSVNELWTGTIGIVRLDLASAAGELVLDSISFETVSYAK